MAAFFQSVGETIVEINSAINGFVWGPPVLILIAIVGVYFTVRLGFLQFGRVGFIFRRTIGRAFKKAKEDSDTVGDITSFQAAMTSVAAIVGSGNIAGVATAIVCGGPGAVLWMLVAAFMGMATKFAEIALGIKYRHIHKDGTISGGAMYYLADGLKQKWLGILFSILVIPFAFVISAIVDTNTIADTMYNTFAIPVWVSGIILAVMTGAVVFGGVKRIGQVCAFLAPFMGGAYVLTGIVIIMLHLKAVPAAAAEIWTAAFTPQAITGGAVGSVFIAMRYGVARGIFSNEAGLGTAAMVHSAARVKHPIDQALWGPVEVFLDTVLVCSVSALAIVLSGLWREGYEGAYLTKMAFDKMLGPVGGYICLGSVFLFGYSCLISYYTYAERAAEYMFGEKSKVVIKVLWVGMVFVGAITTLGFAWDLADTCNGLMIIPNLIGLLLLSGQVVKLKKEYFAGALSADKAARLEKKAARS